jgi:nitroreductase
VRKQATFDSLSQVADTASHLIVVMMKRTPAAKIPWNEEFAATAAAVQNILLGAEALQLAAIWNTGGMALKQPMKDYLQLEADDCVMGFIYLGYTEHPAGS